MEAQLQQRLSNSANIDLEKIILSIFSSDIKKATLVHILGELCSLGYIAMLILFINYLNQREASVFDAVVYLVIFSCLTFGSVIFKNQHSFQVLKIGIQLKKVLRVALYKKILRVN